MSKYTTEVRFLCETEAGLTESKGFDNIESILDIATPKIFNFWFPIYDENYRLVLERKILKHYYVREIGAETVGLWKMFLSNRLNEIMPYYNKLYLSELLDFNPFYDVDYIVDHKGDGTSDARGEISNTRTDNLHQESTEGGEDSVTAHDVKKNSTWDIYSDTPQGALTNVQNETYLTNARKITEDGTGSSFDSTKEYGKNVTTDNTGTQEMRGNTNTNILTTDTYIDHVKGKRSGVSYAKLLEEYRKSLLNIDMMIIDDLKDLFFGLW